MDDPVDDRPPAAPPFDGDALLRGDYTVETPESVAFGYPVAGLGSRFIGALVDSIAIVGGAGGLLCPLTIGLAAWADRNAPEAAPVPAAPDAVNLMPWVEGLIMAVAGLILFAIVWGYYIVFETLWAGQTPGKRVAGTRVVRLDGGAAGFREAAVRNLVRFADFLPLGYGVGVAVMFADRHTRRLGDLAAGTVVIREQRRVTLADVAVAADGAVVPGAAPPPAS